ncbi:MAG TPA: DUF465 domain-containing protein [Novosphingobium sp.]|nr:DUF465 domain-containing protein [Novosphingobium sp.]
METSHVSALMHKHAGLEQKIKEEMARRIPDPAMIQLLKRQKLRIKDAIALS